MYMINVNVQTLERNKSNKFQSFRGIILFAYLSNCIIPFKIKTIHHTSSCIKKDNNKPTVRDFTRVLD